MHNRLLNLPLAVSLLIIANTSKADDRYWEGEAIANVETIGCYTLRSFMEAVNFWKDGRYRTAVSTRGCQAIDPGQLGMIIRGNDREEINNLARFVPRDGYGDYLIVFRDHFDRRR